MHMRVLPKAAVLAVVAMAAATARGQGMLIPTENALPPLAIRSHKVDVSIEAQTALTKVEQVFENNTDRRLEARFLFPVPRGAALTKFTMIVNGQEKAGELVEKNHARQIYNSIVSRSLDPGILEYVGQDLIRADIFPIEPHSTQKISVTFSAVAPREGELVSYVYPLRTSDKRGARVRDAFTLNVHIKSPVPIRNVYSPSHSIIVGKVSETEATVAFEQAAAGLDKDFQLYYGVSDKDVGLNLVTHRPATDKPGHFLMLMSPRAKAQTERLVARDVILVMDTSGSMAGEKIKQAREALKYCVANLNAGDRFNIIRFSTEVEGWKEAPVPADEANRAAAVKYIETLEAEGGTNIDGALKTALTYKRQDGRPYVVMFFTDGKPTLGDTTDPKEIIKGVQAALADDKARSTRVFTWGVGYDLDTHLLDQVATLGGGVSEYVAPQEDIAAKVAAFYEKSSRPVLTDLKLELVGDKVQIVDMYPKRLPDLYAGGQLVVFGRYTGNGAVAMKVSGLVNGKPETFTYEGDFADRQAKNGFIEPLWAKRRIGHLLEQIRLHGENNEMVADVIRLSKEYGIQTPYTSWLILEDGMQVPPQDGNWNGRRGNELALGRPARGGAGGRFGAGDERRDAEQDRLLRQRLEGIAKNAPADPKTAAPAPTGKPGAEHGGATGPAAAPPALDAAAVELRKEKARELEEGLAKKDGKAGVEFAKYLGDLKNADKDGQGQATVAFRRAAGTKFFRYQGLWVDEKFTAEVAVTAVKFGSDAYFLLLDRHPELAEVFKLGTGLIYVTAEGKAVAVTGAGEEKLTDAQVKDLFTAAPAPAKK